MDILSCQCYLFHITDAKEQVLANLANFSYDPVNYDYLRELKVTTLFLETLSENNKTLVRFAIAGICNLCSGEFDIFIIHPRYNKNF